jgi:hypothetical protein
MNEFVCVVPHLPQSEPQRYKVPSEGKIASERPNEAKKHFDGVFFSGMIAGEDECQVL